MRFWRLLILLFSGIMILSGVTLAESEAGTYDLKYRLNEGETYAVRFTTDAKITQTVLGQSISQISRFSMLYSFEVLSPEDGVMNLSASCDAIQGEYQTPFYHIFYNSQEQAQWVPGRFKPHQSQLTTDHIITLNPLGQIKIERSSSDSQADEEIDTDDPEALLSLLGNSDLKSDIQPIFCNVFPNYGKEPLAADATWSSTINVSDGNVLMAGPATYRLRKVLENEAVLEVEADLFCNYGTQYNLNGMGCESAVNLTGKLKGFIEVKKQNGLPVRGEYTIVMSGTLRRMGLDIPVTMEMKIQFRSEQAEIVDDAAVTDREQGGAVQ